MALQIRHFVNHESRMVAQFSECPPEIRQIMEKSGGKVRLLGVCSQAMVVWPTEKTQEALNRIQSLWGLSEVSSRYFVPREKCKILLNHFFLGGYAVARKDSDRQLFTCEFRDDFAELHGLTPE